MPIRRGAAPGLLSLSPEGNINTFVVERKTRTYLVREVLVLFEMEVKLFVVLFRCLDDVFEVKTLTTTCRTH